jgi:hypothetical protein
MFAFSVDLFLMFQSVQNIAAQQNQRTCLAYLTDLVIKRWTPSNKWGSRDRGSSSFTALHRTELRSTRRKYDSCPLGLHIRHTCHLWSASFLDVVARGNAFSDKLPHEDPNFERDGNFSYLSEMFPRISFTRFPIA